MFYNIHNKALWAHKIQATAHYTGGVPIHKDTSRELTRPYRSNAKQRVTQTYMPTFGEGFNYANFSGWESCNPNWDS